MAKTRARRRACAGVGAWLVLLFGLGHAQPARAESPPAPASEPARAARGLLSPTPEAPARAAPGAFFVFEVQTASALTPPPGVQEPRAYRAFSVALCARGIALGDAPEQLCFGLSIQNLRPLASHSLAYRVEVFVPQWVAPGAYSLRARFPGGGAEVADGVLVGAAAAAVPSEACAPEVTREGTGLGLRVAASEAPCVARVHVANSAGVSSNVAFTAYPRAGQDGELEAGAVLHVPCAPGQAVQLMPKPSVPAEAREIAVRPPRPGVLGALSIAGLQPEEQVYWSLSPWESALGPEAPLRLLGPRAPRVTALVLREDGASELLTRDLTTFGYPRGVGGCSLGTGQGPFAWAALGLLFLALSRKLGRRARRG